ncbi:hypothetical protein VPH35_115115 [Triticum aestivum]
MAEEPSTKRHCGETSDQSIKEEQSIKEDGVQVPSEKRDHTTKLDKVEIHGKETLEVVCTSNPDTANEMLTRLFMKAVGRYPRFVGVDVEYTRDDEPPQYAAVLQLCVDELCLVYHIAAATKWPKRLKSFLQEKMLFTFAGFSIHNDKQMLKMSGLEINPEKYIDIQKNYRVPYAGRKKQYDSLADVAASVIHPFYQNMKKKINRTEDHKLWGISPLPDYLIEYAAKDAYATYKAWKIIDNIKSGVEISEAQEADPYYHCHYAA